MVNIFTPSSASYVGAKAATQPGIDEQASVGPTRIRWFDSPLMFIGVIVVALVATAFVEKKVG